MFPPDLLHRKLSLLMLQVFLIYAKFNRLFLSAILNDLSAILQAERLAFRFYDAFIVLVPLVSLSETLFWTGARRRIPITLSLGFGH